MKFKTRLWWFIHNAVVHPLIGWAKLILGWAPGWLATLHDRTVPDEPVDGEDDLEAEIREAMHLPPLVDRDRVQVIINAAVLAPPEPTTAFVGPTPKPVEPAPTVAACPLSCPIVGPKSGPICIELPPADRALVSPPTTTSPPPECPPNPDCKKKAEPPVEYGDQLQAENMILKADVLDVEGTPRVSGLEYAFFRGMPLTDKARLLGLKLADADKFCTSMPTSRLVVLLRALKKEKDAVDTTELPTPVAG